MTALTGASLEVVRDGQVLKSLGGYTWPGIEYGEPPSYKHSFFEYVDALRLGDLERFKDIEAESGEWWFPTLDRGAGACLHFAVDHGQLHGEVTIEPRCTSFSSSKPERLECVRFLVEQRGAEVNQQDASKGWTPLHRCALMAHYTHQPYLQLFEYLLQQGADPALLTKDGWEDPQTGKKGLPLGVLDVVVEQGRGWQPGQVRERLASLIKRHERVYKKPAFTYSGPPHGPIAVAVLAAWEILEAKYPPKNWRPPPPAGFQGAQGMRLAEQEPWRPAGQNDGSCFMRPMTEQELQQQSKSISAA